MNENLNGSKNTPQLEGPWPKIGIRPTIDGRQGVRQELETQTMAMAHAAARLITARLRHAHGGEVECVMAKHCISGATEAARTAEAFRQQGVGVILTVSPCWCYGTETMDMSATIPQAVWGFNGSERPGAVYLSAVLAGYHQKGMPAFAIYGRDVQDASDTAIPGDVQEKILAFVRAALVVATQRERSYLSMGSTSMGIAGSIVQEAFFQDYLGMRNEYVDMSEFIRRIERGIYDARELDAARRWADDKFRTGCDPNPQPVRRSHQQKIKDWDVSLKMALIARDLMVGNPILAEAGFHEESLGHNAIIAGFQGQRQWTDHFPNGDVAEALLNTSFDWNGPRQPYLLATENDSLNGVVMLWGHLLTATAQLFADVRTYWSPEAVKRVTGHQLTGLTAGGIIHLINSGPAALDWTGEQTRHDMSTIKPFWEIDTEDIDSCLAATLWCPADVGYFRGGGYSTDFLTRGGMPVTMSRINLVKGLGPVLQVAEGHTVDLPPPVHDALDMRTNPTWPTTWFVPKLTGQGAFKDVYSVMSQWGANHAAVCFGHVGGDLLTASAMLRIPVSMHNVEEERVFRPAMWSAFGTGPGEGADFRACRALGPLYG